MTENEIIFLELYFLYVFRYMMLIEDKDQVFMFDRDNSVFRINHVRFPENSNCSDHLRDTLVDGVSRNSELVLV